jgi:DNA-binding transcriptional LysR family regulator
VCDGLGVAQFPTWLVADALKDGTLQTALSPHGVQGAPIHVLWPTTRNLAPKVQAAVDALVQAFSQVAPWEQDAA